MAFLQLLASSESYIQLSYWKKVLRNQTKIWQENLIGPEPGQYYPYCWIHCWWWASSGLVSRGCWQPWPFFSFLALCCVLTLKSMIIWWRDLSFIGRWRISAIIWLCKEFVVLQVRPIYPSTFPLNFKEIYKIMKRIFIICWKK